MTAERKIAEVAMRGYPPGQAHPLFISEHGDHAAVLLRAEPIEVVFKGERWRTQTQGGVFFAIWWDELDPSNYLEPAWPEEVARG